MFRSSREPGLEEPLPVPEENLVAPPPVYDDVPLAVAPEQTRLDELFGQLKKARDRRYASTIADSIWTEWYRSGSATVDLMMTWANDAFEEKKYNVALDFLDQVVIRAPDFAEGWNRRATVHYSMDNFAKSMTDIEKDAGNWSRAISARSPAWRRFSSAQAARKPR